MTHPSDASSEVYSEARAAQCRMWNATRAHQVAAGKARAARMTQDERSAFGHAAFDAFSARFRAVQGLPPLSADAAARDLTPRDSRRLGMPLAPHLAATIHRAWCAGQLFPVSAWLSDDPPADPHGCGAMLPHVRAVRRDPRSDPGVSWSSPHSAYGPRNPVSRNCVVDVTGGCDAHVHPYPHPVCGYSPRRS